MAKLAASILTADFCTLGETLKMYEDNDVGYLHLDVMDGDFVPNISFGPPVIKSLAGKTSLPFDIHLMVTEPDRFVEDYVTDNTEYIVVHQEACKHLDRTLQHIKSLGVKNGVALNPATQPEAIEYVLDKIDQVLVMSVNPGFGGQAFIKSSLTKIKTLASIREQKGYTYKIAIDGGINADNLKSVVDAGADIIITGSAILGKPDPVAELIKFNSIIGGDK